MLIPKHVDPKLCIYYNASFLLKELKMNKSQSLLSLYQNVKSKVDMSFSVYVLCLDWLYLIDAASIDDKGEISLCSLKNL